MKVEEKASGHDLSSKARNNYIKETIARKTLVVLDSEGKREKKDENPFDNAKSPGEDTQQVEEGVRLTLHSVN